MEPCDKYEGPQPLKDSDFKVPPMIPNINDDNKN